MALKAILGPRAKREKRAIPVILGLEEKSGLKGRKGTQGHRVTLGLRALLALLLDLGKSLLL